jgi:MraZ protein
VSDEPVTAEKGVLGGLGLFVGTVTHSLDPKKRVTIPSDWRELVGEPSSVYVIPDFRHRCLNVYPAREMLHKLERIRQHSMADQKAMQFARVLGEASALLKWDTQGRIRISDRQLEFAGLTDQVVMVGALNRFELWSPENRGTAGGMEQDGLEEAARYVGF